MVLDFNGTPEQAIELLGITASTLKRWRQTGRLPAYLYTQHGQTVRYCLPLLRDWHLNPKDLDAQARAIEMLQEQRVTGNRKKAGRKAA